MPELPDIVVYVQALDRLLVRQAVNKVVVKSPFVLRTYVPALEEIEGQRITGFSRLGKRIVWEFESGIRCVFHLMIAGRFHWKADRIRLPTDRNDLLAFQFEHGTLMLTEASKNKRASVHVLAAASDLSGFDRGGLEVLECTVAEFQTRLDTQNRTLKRALTDPTIFSGIGNAYSDEILLEAGLSPTRRTSQLSGEEKVRLFASTGTILNQWVTRLSNASANSFPEKVTAFRPEMMAHGKFGQPCPKCGTLIQRIRYADNECNYCPRCQTGGKILADRSLSRLLKGDWPKTIEELEGNT